MATNPFDKIEPTWRSMADMEYGHWMVRLGEALAKHEDHQGENGIPRPLAGGQQLIDNGNQVITLAIAAEGRDRFRLAELEAFRPQTDLQVSATINWVVTRSVVENKPSIRENLPLEEKKEKMRVRNSGTGSVSTPTNLKVKRSDEHSGTAYISVSRDPWASIYYAQYCPQSLNPADEASWTDGGQSDSCRSIEVKGLTPGEVYHFRVRCFGGGQYSLWSQIVTIRVL